eukprot:gene9889-11712_t
MVFPIKNIFVLWCALAPLACYGFKSGEFKTCEMNNFCTRNRGRERGQPWEILGKFSFHGSKGSGLVARATVIDTSTPQAPYTLELSAYIPGAVRIKMKPAPPKDKSRFEVSDVLVDSLPSKELDWDAYHFGDEKTIFQLGDTEVVITHSPLRLETVVGGKPGVVFNERNLLNYEHLRDSKQDSDPPEFWEEKFKSHTDTIKRGPQSIMLDVSFPSAEEVYGIPEHATSFALNPTKGKGINSEPYRLFNLDVFEYLHESPFGLYGSIPVLMAHGKGLSTGVFWLNAAEMYVDISRHETTNAPESAWMSESGIIDLFVMTGPTPAKAVEQYSSLTGMTDLPPLFAIGYHQCRWNYRDEADIAAVDAGFDENQMPYDVIWLDIEHTNGKRYMTWDQHLFPNPVSMQEGISNHRRKMVTIVDPHIKRTQDYGIHTEATSLGHYVKDKDGKDYEGWCWPGSSSYLDFTSPTVRAWWGSKFGLDKYIGSTKDLFIWNDMNEPSVFNGPEVTMPKAAVHHGDWEHRDVHNLYGYYVHMATADGLRQRGTGDQRPFVLSRAFFAGTQRVGPIWTGDNAADWNHLQVSVPMLLTLGMSGLTFSGADVGGFFGNPDAELLVRWYQVGAFYPFFRGHAHQETRRREPWLFGDPTTSQIRNALRMRYTMLPYIYTLFFEASRTNAPVMRPMFYEFPDEPELFKKQDAFFLGPAVLVCPVLHKAQPVVQATLPGTGLWYELATGRVHQAPMRLSVPTESLDALPVFLRGGHVVARRERPRRSSSAMSNDPYTLLIMLDAAQSASGELYEDDGTSTSHQQGAFVHRRFAYSGATLSCSAASLGAGGSIYTTATKVERIVILGLPSMPSEVSVAGTDIRLE